MTTGQPNQPSHHDDPRARHDLLVMLVQGIELEAAVPAALELVGEDPLASAGRFSGDVLRALMEVHNRFWSRHPHLYDRYRDAVRAGAVARRGMPPDRRFDFWSPLGIPSANE